jgi:hypothetical protein
MSKSRYLEGAHSNLLERMKKIGYGATAEGVCVGIAFMGMQAFLAGQLSKFDERFGLLHHQL